METAYVVRRECVVTETLEARQLLSTVVGGVFSDLNGDGIQQTSERGVANQVVYVDVNRDGIRQSAEPTARTKRNGSYRIAGLKAGNYAVRLALASGIDQTSPAGPVFRVSNERTSTATRIEVVPGPVLRKNATALAAARAAADEWSKRLVDPVHLRIDMELAPLGGGGLLAAASSVKVELAYNQVRDALVASAGHDEMFARGLPLTSALRYRLPPDDGHPFTFDGHITLNRANALALGYLPDELPAENSEYRDNALVDGSILFNRDASFDFNPADGIAKGKDDFRFTVLHEIGHILGFESAIDVLDLNQYNPDADHTFSPTPLDLFRLKPGTGGGGFTTAQRQWVTGKDQAVQVLYDGGIFNPANVRNVRGLKPGDLPMSTGLVGGDGQQASHWKDDERTGVAIGVMDPTLGKTTSTPSENDLRLLGLIGWDIRTLPAGRNVTISATAGANANFGIRGGDDNDELHEAITLLPGSTTAGQVLWAGDVDLYAFHGLEGETFTVDIDAVGSFDSVLRFLDADGRAMAFNDNGIAPGEKADGRSSYFRFTLPRDGTYFAGVSGKGNERYNVINGNGDGTGRTGRYTLNLRDVTTDDDNSLATATQLKIGATVDGEIEPTRDVDLYRITVVAGQRIGFDIDRPRSSIFDSFIRLFDASGVEIEGNDDAPARGEEWTYESYVEHRFNKGGTYFIGVSSTGNDRYNPRNSTGMIEGASCGTYTLTARIIA